MSDLTVTLSEEEVKFIRQTFELWFDAHAETMQAVRDDDNISVQDAAKVLADMQNQVEVGATVLVKLGGDVNNLPDILTQEPNSG